MRISPLRLSDAQHLANSFSKHEVYKLYARGKPIGEEQWRKSLHHVVHRWAEKMAGAPSVLSWRSLWLAGGSSGSGYLGHIGVGCPNKHGVVELSYSLHPDHWGHGYVTEALKIILVEDVLAVEEAKAIKITAHPENLRSLAVATRIGMVLVREGKQRFGSIRDKYKLSVDKLKKRATEWKKKGLSYSIIFENLPLY